MGANVIAYDFGTSGVKAALVSLEGRLLACETQNYSLKVPAQGWAEQDPQEYWDALVACTRRIGGTVGFKDLAGISLCTQWKGMIPIDADGKVLHDNVIWMDARAAAEARQLNERFKTEFFTAQNYWARLKWCFDNTDGTYAHASDILEVNSFIKWKFTGRKAADISNDFIHSYDAANDAFYKSILDECGIDRTKFPRLTLSTEKVGEVTAKAAAETGIPEGTPVFSGSGDIPAIAIGSGCAGVGSCHAYFGTSGWIGRVVEHDSRSIYGVSSAFTKERDITLCTLQSVGMAYNWTLHQLYAKEWNELGGKVFDLVNEEVEDIPAGSEGVLATSWVAGELPPLSEKSRTVFLNLSSAHDRRHMVNAMMEAICYMFRFRIEDNGWEKPAVVSVVGGGANSAHWMQMLADVLKVEVSVPENNQHAGALGAAAEALVGLGLLPSLDDVSLFVHEKAHYVPRPEQARTYDRIFEIYKGLNAKLMPTFEALQEAARPGR